MRFAILLGACLCAATPAFAQDPPPRLPWFAVDVHGSVPLFPNPPTLAQSRNLEPGELPGRGLGVQLALHVYPVRWRAVTFGIGGGVIDNPSGFTPPATT